jgi:hypothetical protein
VLFALTVLVAPAGAQTDELLETEAPTRAAVNVRDAAPGDSVQVVVTARNVAGTELVMQATLAGLAGPSLLLNGPNGLHAAVDTCSEPWTQVLSPGNGAPTYECDGTQRTLASRAAIRSLAERPLVLPSVLQEDEVVSVRATIVLPPTGDNAYEDLSASTVRLDVQATLIEEPEDGTGFDDLEFDELAFTGAALLFVLTAGGAALIFVGLHLRKQADRREAAAGAAARAALRDTGLSEPGPTGTDPDRAEVLQ